MFLLKIVGIRLNGTTAALGKNQLASLPQEVQNRFNDLAVKHRWLVKPAVDEASGKQAKPIPKLIAKLLGTYKATKEQIAAELGKASKQDTSKDNPQSQKKDEVSRAPTPPTTPFNPPTTPADSRTPSGGGGTGGSGEPSGASEGTPGDNGTPIGSEMPPFGGMPPGMHPGMPTGMPPFGGMPPIPHPLAAPNHPQAHAKAAGHIGGMGVAAGVDNPQNPQFGGAAGGLGVIAQQPGGAPPQQPGAARAAARAGGAGAGGAPGVPGAPQPRVPRPAPGVPAPRVPGGGQPGPALPGPGGARALPQPPVI